MSIRTLWVILIKLLGLYQTLQFFYALPTLFATIIYFRGEDVNNSALQQLALLLFSISLNLLIVVTCIFRTDWIINKLRLDKGTAEDRLELNSHRSTVLKIAVIVTGGLLLVESLPMLLKETFSYYQDINQYNGFKQYPRGGYIVLDLIKVLISYFMVSSSRLIVNFIERKRKGKIATE